MSYSDRPAANWGCLAGAGFFIFFGMPLIFAIGLAGPCLPGESCLDKRVLFVAVLVAVPVVTVAIQRLTNWLVERSSSSE